jgi:KipI family sensor histidine kinase inhibitor
VFELHSAGENALILYLGREANPAIAARVQAAGAAIESALGEDLVDLVPSYASVLIIYDALRTDHLSVGHRVRTALTDLADVAESRGRTVVLPVYYAPEAGADLEAVSERAGLPVEEVIRLHSACEYRVYAIGFAPGFAYLGQVDERIAAPRLATPRPKVPRGAVAIADRQTAVYPAVSPGGWNLIGRCPTRMFDPAMTPAMPVTVGDRVRFEVISRARFLDLGGELP